MADFGSQPLSTLLGVIDWLAPNTSSIARGEPAPPIANFPSIPGKLPPADPRASASLLEVIEQLSNAVPGPGAAAKVAAGLPALMAKLGRRFGPEELAAAKAAMERAAGGHAPLQGLPQKPIDVGGSPYIPGPYGPARDVAAEYTGAAGIPYNKPQTYAPINEERATRIAKAFDEMPHAPNDPRVQASYDAMINETVAQYRALEKAGIKFEFIKPGQKDPYGANPRMAQRDVTENKHLWVFPTEGGFGSGTEGAAEAMKNNPLLRPTDIEIGGKKLVANDVFRIVHDFFGHMKEGNGFRAAGEENAWRAHSAMYSDLARPAMTSETRGQNSWVNYGPHGEFNRTASAADTKYADQKIGLLPDWAVNEGRGDPTIPQAASRVIDAAGVVRGRSGRPIETPPLPIGTENAILEAGFNKVQRADAARAAKDDPTQWRWRVYDDRGSMLKSFGGDDQKAATEAARASGGWIDKEFVGPSPVRLAKDRGGAAASDFPFDNPNRKPVEPALLNIGLHVPGGGKLDPDQAIKALKDAGVDVTGTAVHQSNTEPTLVAQLSRALTPDEASTVSRKLKQESIAQYNPTTGEGALHGPKAADWGPFNPAYFLTPEGKPLAAGPAADVIPFTARPRAAPGEQTVANPVRNYKPGIYKSAQDVVAEANAATAPESPALKQLFGVTRDDLYQIGKARGPGDAESLLNMPENARGSAAARNVMTPQNVTRLLEALHLAEKKAPGLVQGMDPWYVMDPMYQRMVQLAGPEEAKRLYTNLNAFTAMASPGSDVVSEIRRGSGANWLNEQGRFKDFEKYGGVAEDRRRNSFPQDMASIPGHAYHSTAHLSSMKPFAETGEINMGGAKVPVYLQASGVPETGWRWDTPVGDAHWARAVGLPDTRTAEAQIGRSVRMPELSTLSPWWRDEIAQPLGLLSVPAQARAWGVFGPQTGVDTAIGAPKLELWADQILKRANARGMQPEKLRDLILLGKQHASLAGSDGAFA